MKLTATVAQTSSVLLDTPATVERALGLMKEAAAQGAQVLVFPEAFIGGYPKGADFHIDLGARTADDRDTWIGTLQHIALEGRCFVLSACQHLRRADFPSDRMNNRLPQAPETVLMRGGSAIIDPMGKILAGPVRDQDAVLSAEFDLHTIAMAQLDFDVARAANGSWRDAIQSETTGHA